jgi:EAL domain-containing protein (putative c-di-GMP-specific phosphodiesterase class I)
VNIAIDDCGTAPPCIERLAGLPVSEIKVDRPHIAGMASDPADMATVSSLISLAHGLGLTVVAEGVETEEQRELLRALKCDRIQGYLASKPLPAAGISRLLAGHEAP